MTRVRTAFIIACAVAMSTACATSRSVERWSRVERLPAGSSVRVLTNDAPFVERRLVSADRWTLVVEADGGGPPERVSSDRVLMITKTSPLHPMRRGAIIGAVIGSFQGAFATQGLSCSDCTGQALSMMGLAAAIDAAVGAFMMRDHPPYQVVYRRP